MHIGGRNLRTILGAAFRKEHYVAFFNMWSVYEHPLTMILRYLSGGGTYPYEATVRTPAGPVSIRLYSHHDLLTVNEIFCRMDYAVPGDVSRVVDIGSNIGISALYFLTRNRHCRVRLFEPLPENVAKLKHTLRGYESRYTIDAVAVGLLDGEVEFGREETGRYGGINKATGSTIKVRCVEANRLLSALFSEADFPDADLLKVDIEGLESQLVASLSADVSRRIRLIYAELDKDGPELEGFVRRRYGPIVRWIKQIAPRSTPRPDLPSAQRAPVRADYAKLN